MVPRISVYLPVLLVLCSIGRLAAQQYYTVSKSTGTYTELTNPNMIVVKPDTLGYGLPIPFTMEGFGLPIDMSPSPARVYIFTGGLVAVDVPSQQRLCVFDAFVSQLIWRDSTSSLSYTLEGRQGEQVLKVQWKNLRMVGNPVDDFVNVQLWLYQQDNSFEVHVGPNRVTGTFAYYGNEGPAIGGFVSSYDFSVYYSAIHLKDDRATPGTDQVQGYYPMNTTPANGTIYRFTYNAPSSVEAPGAATNALRFQPNPCTERTRIQLPVALSGMRPSLAVHDALGREVLRVDNVADGDYIERGGLAAGLYHVTLHANDGRTYRGGTLVITK